MESLLNWTWQGCAVAIAAAALLRVTRSCPARVRYVGLWVVLLSILLLPCVPFLQAAVRPAPGAAAAAPADIEPLVPIPTGRWTSIAAALVLWAAWSIAYSVRVWRAALALRRARQHCRPVPAAVELRLQRWSEVRATGRPTSLVVSDRVASAAVLAGRSPVIALAPALLDRLDPDELDCVVIHEWTHVQRRDDLAHLLQILVRIVAGWHPAVWWCDRRLHIEREIACDEFAVEITGSVRQYAACLTRLASLRRVPMPALPVVAAVSSSNLRCRIERLVAFDRITHGPTTTRALIGAAVTLGAVMLTVGGLPVFGTTPAPVAGSEPGGREPSSMVRSVRLPASAGVGSRRDPTDSTGWPVRLADRRGEARGSALRARRPQPDRTSTAARHGDDRGGGGRVSPASAFSMTSPARSNVAVLDSESQDVPLLTSRPAVAPSTSDESAAIAALHASRDVVHAEALSFVSRPASPWSAAAEAAEAVGRGSQNAALKTAGFFNRLARSIAGSF